MVKCPDCKRAITEARKKWKYGHFDVESFSCECGAVFNCYKKDGVESFKLKKDRGGKFRKPSS